MKNSYRWYQHFSNDEMAELLKLVQTSKAIAKLIDLLNESDQEKFTPTVRAAEESSAKWDFEARQEEEKARMAKELEESYKLSWEKTDSGATTTTPFPPFRLFPKSYKRG